MLGYVAEVALRLGTHIFISDVELESCDEDEVVYAVR